MTWEVEFSDDAIWHLRGLTARERNVGLDAIEEQLTTEPTTATHHRKPLRPNPLSAWELRVGDHRVFSNVEEDRAAVLILPVGVKRHNRLFIDDREFPL